MPTVLDEKGRSLVPRRSVATRGAHPNPHRNDPRWLLVERIAASRSLGRSERLAEFLRYIADHSIRGDEKQITEQQIGVNVFGRALGYDSNNDNIVRNYARTLRKRLEDYFRREGLDEPLTMLIPRGGYVPVFSLRDPESTSSLSAAEVALTPAPDCTVQHAEPARRPAEEEQAPSVAATPPAARSASAHARIVHLAALASVCALIVGFLAGRIEGRLTWFRTAPAHSTRTLWSHMFAGDRDTFVVPSDGGLVMLQSFSRAQASLPEYVNGSYRTPAAIDREMQGLLQHPAAQDMSLLGHKVEVMAARRYTSVVDLDIALQIARLPEVVPDHLVVRFARDLRIDDLRNGNGVLIGSSDANPWVALFESQLNFQFTRGSEFGGSGTIVNMHPLPHAQPSYASVTGDSANNTYGVIAYVPNLSGTGHILIVEGVDMAGTQAAGNLLMNEEQMRGLLARALDGNGRLQSFEILLKTNSIASNAAGVDVLSERVHPAATP